MIDFIHALGVYGVSIKIAELENISQEEKVIVNTASLYRDAGFLFNIGITKYRQSI